MNEDIQVEIQLTFNKENGYAVAINGNESSRIEYFDSFIGAYDFVQMTKGLMATIDVEVELTIYEHGIQTMYYSYTEFETARQLFELFKNGFK